MGKKLIDVAMQDRGPENVGIYIWRFLLLISREYISRFAIPFITALSLTFYMEANANDGSLVFCPVSRGDSVARVKEVLQIAEDPKPLAFPSPESKYSYQLSGVHIFFDSAMLVSTLQFNWPFAGMIDEISIGDSKETVLRLKGEPAKRIRGWPDDTFRKRRKAEIVENLPDPSPKALIRKAFSQIAEIDRLPTPDTEAWLYNSSERALLRYEFNLQSGKVVAVLSDKGTTKPSIPSTAVNEPNSILEERLSNAHVTEKRWNNGAILTEVKFTGSLQPNIDLGCIPINEVTSKFNPPALIYAAKKCIQQDQYSKAWALLTTGNGFAYYDLKRLADRSTQGARTVLTMNVFADLTNTQRDKTQKIIEEIQADPAQVQAYCTELTRIGPPTYEPQWAILHGIGAYQDPRDGHYLTNVDPKALWEEVLKNRCTPQKS